MNLRIVEDAVYDGEALMGEFDDGKFVPSRLLLERPAKDHRAVDKFVEGLAFSVSYSRQGKRALAKKKKG